MIISKGFIIKVKGIEYKCVNRGLYGNDFIYFFKDKNGKQLGNTGYTENEIDKLTKE
jgi:hypothetical protein